VLRRGMALSASLDIEDTSFVVMRPRLILSQTKESRPEAESGQSYSIRHLRHLRHLPANLF